MNGYVPRFLSELHCDVAGGHFGVDTRVYVARRVRGMLPGAGAGCRLYTTLVVLHGHAVCVGHGDEVAKGVVV